MLRNLVQTVVVLVISFGVGIAGGLLYGLIQNPLRYAEVDPEDLSLAYKEEYLRLVAAQYAQTGALPAAQQRLDQLGFTPAMVQARAESAVFEREPGAGALARLATDLGAGSERLESALITPSPTVTSTPTPTITSTPRPTQTRTSRPRATATEVATETVPPTISLTATVGRTQPPTAAVPRATVTTAATRLAPTATVPRVPVVPSATASPVLPTAPPAPTAPPPPSPPVAPSGDIAFEVRGVRMLSIQENGGCEGGNAATVTVLDLAGSLLSGVTVALQGDAGRDTQATGGGGRAVFNLSGTYRALVLTEAGGRVVRSETTPAITSLDPSDSALIAAGYCTDQADCTARRAQTPPQLCAGHYSWEVVFQRTY